MIFLQGLIMAIMPRNPSKESGGGGGGGAAAIATSEGTTTNPSDTRDARESWLQTSKFVFAGRVEELLDKQDLPRPTEEIENMKISMSIK